MALVHKASLKAITNDRTQINVIDSTGDYDAEDNPGGYGSPNPERSDLAVFIFMYDKTPNEDDVLLEDVDNTSPETADEWFGTIDHDSWYQFLVVSVPIWTSEGLNGSGVYIVDSIVYRGSNLYITQGDDVGTDPLEDEVNWRIVEVEDLPDYLETSSTVIYGVSNDVVMVNSGVCYAKLVARATEEGCCDGCEDTAVMAAYKKVRVLLESAKCNRDQQKYADADKNVDAINEICEEEIDDCATC